MPSPLQLEFGYYPRAFDVSAGSVKVSTLPNLESTVRDINVGSDVFDGWIYAPPQHVRDFNLGNVRRPYPSRVFGLPKTHVIEHSACDGRDHLVFLVWALSLFSGLRLSTTEAGFLDATPVVIGKCVDFVPLGQTAPTILGLTDVFWMKNRATPIRAKLFASAVHALFLAKNPVLICGPRRLFCTRQICRTTANSSAAR
jgi:hypothetical protein